MDDEIALDAGEDESAQDGAEQRDASAGQRGTAQHSRCDGGEFTLAAEAAIFKGDAGLQFGFGLFQQPLARRGKLSGGDGVRYQAVAKVVDVGFEGGWLRLRARSSVQFTVEENTLRRGAAN